MHTTHSSWFSRTVFEPKDERDPLVKPKLKRRFALCCISARAIAKEVGLWVRYLTKHNVHYCTTCNSHRKGLHHQASIENTQTGTNMTSYRRQINLPTDLLPVAGSTMLPKEEGGIAASMLDLPRKPTSAPVDEPPWSAITLRVNNRSTS